MNPPSTDIRDYIIRTSEATWQPLVENGTAYPGVFVMSLRKDASQGRSPTILLRFEAGASYPYHNHPGGEEILVLSGEVTIESATLREGDYLYTPPGFKHAVRSETGCVLFLMIPEEVEIL